MQLLASFSDVLIGFEHKRKRLKKDPLFAPFCYNKVEHIKRKRQTNMRYSTREQRRRDRIKRPLWKKILLGILTPFLTVGIWYGSSLATYFYFPDLNYYFIRYSRSFYLILSGLLYSSLVLSMLISIWVWWKLTFNEKFRWWHWRPLLITTLLVVPVFVYFYTETEKEVNAGPKIISHRGIDNQNAAENTIEALRLTNREKPDYIEIDIYETADSEFIVFHDANLSHKAGIPKEPHDLTLAELTAITVTEPSSKYSGKIPSFDQMLDEADKLHQKLLIDIKVSPKDSPKMIDNFLKKYQSRLEKKQHQVQSGDIHVMQKITNHSPKFDTFLITNSITNVEIPGLTGYSVPLLDLTEELYNHIVEKDYALYAWTVNDTDGIVTSEYLEVDAIITDYMSKTKEDLKQIKDQRDYSFPYYRQLHNLHIFPMI